MKSVVRLKGSTRSLVSRYERLPFTVYYGLLCVLIFTHCAATAQSSQYSFLGKKELAQHDIYGIVQDFDNILYLTTNKGVVKYDGYSFSLIIQKPGIVGTSFFSPKVSAKGDVYCSNLYGQVLKVVGDSLTIYFDEESQQKSLKTNFVFMDNDEMLVMGLHLYKVTPTSDTMLYDELPIGTSYSNFYQESPSKISFYHSSGTGYVKISVLGGVQVEKINIPAREAVVFGLIDLQGQPLFYNQETTELVEGNDLTGYFTSERSINNGEVVRYYLLDDKLCVLNNTAGVRFFSKQCDLWENQVQIHKITITLITEANVTNKTKEVSEYKAFDALSNKYDLIFKWICYKYKGKFKTLFEEIMKGTPDLSVNILDEC